MFRLFVRPARRWRWCCLLTSSASAQFGRGFQIPPTVQNMMLLRTEAVQKELGLSTTSKPRTSSNWPPRCSPRPWRSSPGLQDLTPEERQKEMPDLMKMMNEKGKELQAKVDKILDAKQTARMNELSLQRRGVEALQDDDDHRGPEAHRRAEAKAGRHSDEAADKQQEIIKAVLAAAAIARRVREKIRPCERNWAIRP